MSICGLFVTNSKLFFVVVISDKQVPFRSLCSLPTAYLYINGNGDNGEFNVRSDAEITNRKN